MPANRQKFSQLLAPGLAAIFFRQLKDKPPQWEKWMPSRTSRRAYEEEFKLAGLGQFTFKAEGAVYTFDEPIPGDTLRFVHQTFGLGFRVTEEMLEDDLYGIMQRMSKELARGARLNKEVQAFSVLNNAFDPAFPGYTPAEALCQTGHVLLNGDTLDNLVTGDFSQDALQSALEMFDTFTDDRGYKVDVDAKMVIHSMPDFWEVHKVLKSQLEANTADNNINVIRTMFGLMPQKVNYLTDPDAWFVTASKGDIDSGLGARFYIRVNDRFRNDDDPLTGDAIFTGRHRISAGWGDFRWVVGSEGA